MPEFKFAAEDLPDPIALGVILRHWMEADLARRPRKEAEEMVEDVARRIALDARMTNVVSFRPPEQDDDVRRVKREAAAWFERAVPLLIASLPRK